MTMNILLSNDDGYMAMGLKALDAILSEAGHKISVAAPDSEQSGKSHSFTITGRMRAVEYAPGHYHFSGTPVDCIIYISGILPFLTSLYIFLITSADKAPDWSP